MAKKVEGLFLRAENMNILKVGPVNYYIKKEDSDKYGLKDGEYYKMEAEVGEGRKIKKIIRLIP